MASLALQNRLLIFGFLRFWFICSLSSFTFSTAGFKFKLKTPARRWRSSACWLVLKAEWKEEGSQSVTYSPPFFPQVGWFPSTYVEEGEEWADRRGGLEKGKREREDWAARSLDSPTRRPAASNRPSSLRLRERATVGRRTQTSPIISAWLGAAEQPDRRGETTVTSFLPHQPAAIRPSQLPLSPTSEDSDAINYSLSKESLYVKFCFFVLFGFDFTLDGFQPVMTLLMCLFYKPGPLLTTRRLGFIRTSLLPPSDCDHVVVELLLEASGELQERRGASGSGGDGVG